MPTYSWSPARRKNVRASSLSSRADVPASIDNCAERVRSIRQSSRLIPTCAYVRSNNRWIWLKSVSFTKKARDARLHPDSATDRKADSARAGPREIDPPILRTRHSVRSGEPPHAKKQVDSSSGLPAHKT